MEISVYSLTQLNDKATTFINKYNSVVNTGNLQSVAKFIQELPEKKSYNNLDLNMKASEFFNRHHGILNMGDMQSIVKFIQELPELFVKGAETKIC